MPRPIHGKKNVFPKIKYLSRLGRANEHFSWQHIMRKSSLNILVKKAFEIDWEPNIDREALMVLEKCDSTTEILYVLGAAYFIEKKCSELGSLWRRNQLPIIGTTIDYNNTKYQSLWIQCPWEAWFGGFGGGPTACAFVPQLRFPSISYHHDFGVFYGMSDGSGAPWHFHCAVEIDPEVTHADRKEKDQYRDDIVNYDVIRVNDKEHHFLKWFQLVIDRDDNIIEEHLNTIEKQ